MLTFANKAGEGIENGQTKTNVIYGRTQLKMSAGFFFHGVWEAGIKFKICLKSESFINILQKSNDP